MAIEIRPLDGPIGAEVLGVDSQAPLNDEDFQTIENAMFDHLVIALPELEENADWLRSFGHRFGPLVPHILDQFHHPETSDISIISYNMGDGHSRKTPKPAGAFWHSDLSYEAAPSDAIFLYSTHLPKTGGDTLIANMAMAYEALPETMKARLDGLTAIHRWGWNTKGATPTLTARQQATHPDVSHPVVRPHPRTGRKVLYISPGYTVRIEGFEQSESNDLLAELFEHALQPEFQYRHKWGLKQLVGIDNRSSMHCAIADYNEPRRMLRMIVGCSDGQ